MCSFHSAMDLRVSKAEGNAYKLQLGLSLVS